VVQRHDAQHKNSFPLQKALPLPRRFSFSRPLLEPNRKLPLGANPALSAGPLKCAPFSVNRQFSVRGDFLSPHLPQSKNGGRFPPRPAGWTFETNSNISLDPLRIIFRQKKKTTVSGVESVDSIDARASSGINLADQLSITGVRHLFFHGPPAACLG